MDTQSFNTDIPLTPTQQQWLVHFQAIQEQNLSLSAYAKQENIDPNKLYSWKSQLKQKGLFGGTKKSSPAFVQVKPNASAMITTPDTIRIVLPNGICLEVEAFHHRLATLVQGLIAL